MIMSSIGFLYFFLPVFTAVYLPLPKKHKAKILILFELVFLGWGSPLALIPLFVSMLIAYLLGMLIDNLRFKKSAQRVVLAIALLSELSMIGAAVLSAMGKAGSSTLSKAFPPVGVFVYTLSAMSYCLDIYKGECRCDHRFSLVAAFVGFFPVLTAGPLMRYKDVSIQFEAPVMSTDKMNRGISLYLKGLAEKCIISFSMYDMWRQLMRLDIESVSAITAWLGLICAGMYVYFEFASLTHMARGVSLMLGIELPENFDYPYKTVSVTEFVKKFNVSVTAWFTDYIYTPISRLGGKVYLIPAVIITGAAMSLWYGADLSKLMFGIYIGLLCLLDIFVFGRVVKKLPYAVAMVINMMLILLGMVFFVSGDRDYAVSFVLAVFGKNGTLIDNLTLYFFENYAVIILIAIIITTGLADLIYTKLANAKRSFIPFLRPLWQLMLLVLSTAFLSGTVQSSPAFFAL
ncbi:MAG: hypothetical protein IJ740_04250 [Ruminococcus sp.]|nr:hypothetical protein [Ruminococcus sp.]